MPEEENVRPNRVFVTPLRPKNTKQLALSTPLTAGKFSEIAIPPSPFLSRLGYGTGIFKPSPSFFRLKFALQCLVCYTYLFVVLILICLI